MPIEWLVTVGDQERTFRRRRDAIAWLKRLTHDVRPRPVVVKENASCYRYYGPGEDLRIVTCARIHKLGFPPLRWYRARKRKRSLEEARGVDLVAARSPGSSGVDGGDRG
jgi:hypothetical protein